MMVGLTGEQRTMLIDKLPDAANLALGALVFGQFLGFHHLQKFAFTISVMVREFKITDNFNPQLVQQNLKRTRGANARKTRHTRALKPIRTEPVP